jgi:hypothetical protein
MQTLNDHNSQTSTQSGASFANWIPIPHHIAGEIPAQEDVPANVQLFASSQIDKWRQHESPSSEVKAHPLKNMSNKL